MITDLERDEIIGEALEFLYDNVTGRSPLNYAEKVAEVIRERATDDELSGEIKEMLNKGYTVQETVDHLKCRLAKVERVIAEEEMRR